MIVTFYESEFGAMPIKPGTRKKRIKKRAAKKAFMKALKRIWNG